MPYPLALVPVLLIILPVHLSLEHSSIRMYVRGTTRILVFMKVHKLHFPYALPVMMTLLILNRSLFLSSEGPLDAREFSVCRRSSGLRFWPGLSRRPGSIWYHMCTAQKRRKNSTN
ncbi:hypothetical protein EV426DRAFT_587424 [Tirmania nivea]|nr:hypothetical protein EV426DRAFT_587424 [Tirmania nivea]